MLNWQGVLDMSDKTCMTIEEMKKYCNRSSEIIASFLTLACQNILPVEVCFTFLTAGAAYIQVFIFYYHIKYHISDMLNVNCDINQQDLKGVDLNFVKSE